MFPINVNHALNGYSASGVRPSTFQLPAQLLPHHRFFLCPLHVHPQWPHNNSTPTTLKISSRYAHRTRPRTPLISLHLFCRLRSSKYQVTAPQTYSCLCALQVPTQADHLSSPFFRFAVKAVEHAQVCIFRFSETSRPELASPLTANFILFYLLDLLESIGKGRTQGTPSNKVSITLAGGCEMQVPLLQL